MWSRLVGRRDAGLGAARPDDRVLPARGACRGEGRRAELWPAKLLDVAMAFMAGPRLVLLDEPAGGVNPTMLAGLRERLREINAAEPRLSSSSSTTWNS